MAVWGSNKHKNFKARIKLYAGDYEATIWGIVDDDVEQFCLDGCYDAWGRVKATGSNDINLFTDSTESTNWDHDAFRELVYAEQDGKICRIEDVMNKQYFEDTNSMHYASINDPIVYFEDKTLKFLPTALDATTKKIHHIPEYSIDSFDTDTTSIDKFPGKYYDAVVWYACIEIITKKMQILTDDMNNLVDSEEDPEMAQAKGLELQSMQGQLAIFTQRYENLFKKL